MTSVSAERIIEKMSENTATMIADLHRRLAFAEAHVEYLETQIKGLAAAQQEPPPGVRT